MVWHKAYGCQRKRQLIDINTVELKAVRKALLIFQADWHALIRIDNFSAKTQIKGRGIPGHPLHTKAQLIPFLGRVISTEHVQGHLVNRQIINKNKMIHLMRTLPNNYSSVWNARSGSLCLGTL